MFTAQTLTKSSRLLLYATAVLPFVLWSGFTFPYVTIRTVAFRVIIEIVVVLALLLYVRGRVQFSNLKQQYFFWIFLGLLIIESIAALFGESPLASFFGDLERMWGIFTVAHMFLFYVLLRMFFKQREWRIFFHTSFVTSILVSVYGIIQRNPEFFNVYLFGSGEGSRIISTLGNPVYVAIYLLFNIAFATYLLMRTQRGKLWYFYLFVIAINFYAFTLTDIRGAYLGLIIGAAVAALVYVFFGRKRKVKQVIAASFLLGVIVLTLGVQFQRSSLVRTIPVLRRVVTISINDSTAQTRFIGWNAAIQGFIKDPLTGVGMENYNILFNEYFPARYYLLASSETYFDRAHNQFFNILSESGIIALLLYLGFPILIGYYLVRGYRRGKFSLKEFMLFSAISIAYFVYLFFVFDDFHSLLFFGALIALIEYQYSNTTMLIDQDQIAVPRHQALPVVLIAIMVPLVAYSVFNFNYKILYAAQNSGTALLSEDIAISLDHHRKAIGANLIPAENVILNYVDYIIELTLNENIGEVKNDPNIRSNLINAFAETKQALVFEIKKKPNDALFYLKLGQLNNSLFLLGGDVSYLGDAIVQLKKAIELSPERIQMYLVLGETYVLAGEDAKAVEILKQAVALEPDFNATYYFLGRALLTNNELEQAYEIIVNKGFIELNYYPEDTTIVYALAEELAKAGEYEKAVTVYEYLTRIDYADARDYSALAASYVLADRPLDAISAAQKAAELDPSFAQEAALFIQAIEEGRIEELKKSAF